MTEFDEIQKAEHYNKDESGVECIDVIMYRSLPIGNAMKYLWRAGLKDSTTEGTIKDLEKAIYYIKKEIEVIEKRTTSIYITNHELGMGNTIVVSGIKHAPEFNGRFSISSTTAEEEETTND